MFEISVKFEVSIERLSIAFTANGKRQAEIFSLMKNNEVFLVKAYLHPVGDSYRANTKKREMSTRNTSLCILGQIAA